MLSLLTRLLLPAALLLGHTACRAQVYGCTDPLATNYKAAANTNDGSCVYPATTLNAATVAELNDTLAESSGLIYWNGSLWTHNDDSDTTLYAIDTADGHILRRVRIAGAPNRDWEEITQDDDYIYIGDFGNNVSGNRQDLSILRISKSALLTGQSVVTPDRIFFSYADQSSFTPVANNSTDFDCEAFIAAGDSLYLFTKQWISGGTKQYALPKTPGTHVAKPVGSWHVDGLVTGATYLPAKRTIVLSGYKIAGLAFQPLVALLYDFSDYQAFSGNKRRVLVNPGFHQIEAIASADGRQFFLTNERLSQLITIPEKLLRLDLAALLSGWYGSLGIAEQRPDADTLVFFPNPSRNGFSAEVRAGRSGTLEAVLYNEAGQQAGRHMFPVQPGLNKLQIQAAAEYPAGHYSVRLRWEGKIAWGRISLM